MSEVHVYPDVQALMRAAAEYVVTAYEVAAVAHGRFTIALSGGATPLPFYRLLATDEFASRVDWSRVYVFWGDERCVPPDDRESNYHNARLALLDHVPIPMGNIFRIHGELPPEDAATRYESHLRDFFSDRAGGPHFDLVLLGIGDDAHTASLFPFTEALDEQDRWVSANWIEKLGVWRVTLTARALNAGARILFVISGAKKASALQAILHGPRDPHTYPTQLIQPRHGMLTWLVDQDAAGEK